MTLLRFRSTEPQKALARASATKPNIYKHEPLEDEIFGEVVMSTPVKGRKFVRAEKMCFASAAVSILIAFVPIALTDESRLIFSNLILNMGIGTFQIWYGFKGHKKLLARYETRDPVSES